MILAYMLDDDSLAKLSAQLDARQKMIDDLGHGIQTTNMLVSQLQSSLQKADDQINALTKQIADNSTISDVTSQLETKNTQLQGLVQKFGSSIASSADSLTSSTE